MRLLTFYRFDRHYTYDDWLHMKWMRYIDKLPEHTVICYGPGLQENYPDISPLPFSDGILMAELVERYKPDAIALMTKSRQLLNYNPHGDSTYDQRHHTCWLPIDFKDCKIPKFVLEEDYHYETDDRWYQAMGIDLILQRHHCSAQRQEVVPMQWFPFSVDTQAFTPGNRARLNRCCFVGSATPLTYIYRAKAIEKLRAHKMIDVFTRARDRRLPGKAITADQAYQQILQDYTCHLSGTSCYHITPAKMFEIMASGSVMITNDDPHLPEIFPAECYLTYASDGTGVVEAVESVVKSSRKRRDIVDAALTCIRARHSHDVRIGQLAFIVQELITGKFSA